MWNRKRGQHEKGQEFAIRDAHWIRGEKDTKERRTLRTMIQRCHNPANHKYQIYGARGIQVCDRWRSDYRAFLSDMGRAPSASHQIDRIDTNGNYEPGNCRWVTPKQNSRNCRTNRVIEFNGASLPMAEWAERLVLPVATLSKRIDAGWPLEKAFTEPVRFMSPRGHAVRRPGASA